MLNRPRAYNPEEYRAKKKPQHFLDAPVIGDPISEPRYPVRHSGTCIVLGSGWTADDDLARARSIRPDAFIIGVNRSVTNYKCDMMVSLDRQGAKKWQAVHKEEFGPIQLHSRMLKQRNVISAEPWVDYWWYNYEPGGTSSWLAVKIAHAIGFQEIILCGVPLEKGPSLPNERWSDWSGRSQQGSIDTFRSALMRDHFYKPYVKSMSGWTREAFGEPTIEKPPLAIACVLKSGGVYDWDYVFKLFHGVCRHLDRPFKFYCLTDMDSGFSPSTYDDMRVQVIPLTYAWPKWWSKMEMFRCPALYDQRVLFIDLDTIILGDINQIADYRGEFCALNDFNRLGPHVGSGLMAFEGGGMKHLFNKFKDTAEMQMERHRGDQNFIYENSKPDFWQSLYPGQVVSFKPDRGRSVLKTLTGEERIVCFHGKPKPRDVINMDENDRYYCHWVKEHWV